VGKTISEKILSVHCRKDLTAGEIGIADVDFAFAHDGTGPLAYKAFSEMEGDRVFDSSRIALVVDHTVPSYSEEVANYQNLTRAFAAKYGTLLYNDGSGICHWVIPEHGHILPGTLAIGADSHTCTLGALNAFATGVGSSEFASVMLTGQIWLRVPRTIKVHILGSFAKYISAKDLVLSLARRLGASGASYKTLEFCGEGIKNIPVEGRFTICNMAVEMGAKAGIFPADNLTEEWLSRRTEKSICGVDADGDASYESHLEFELDTIEPMVSVPHSIDNAVPVRDLAGREIQLVFIGGCTNGGYESLQVAAEVMKGKSIASKVRLVVQPCSRETYIEAANAGVLGSLAAAGAMINAPGCGPCCGQVGGIPADGEQVVSTTNRNYRGRMGNKNASIYLVSPATAAACAIAGCIVDPREIA
jgi:3-isopropylmalate/(R)-2-methylmalate dehydratase large subunit